MTLGGLLDIVQGIIDKLVPFIIGLAVFIIVWGIFGYISHSADEEKRAQARQFIVWGVVGVFCMLSIWGFVNILYNTFTLDRQIKGDQIPRVPRFEGTVPNGDGSGEYDANWDYDGDGFMDI